MTPAQIEVHLKRFQAVFKKARKLLTKKQRVDLKRAFAACSKEPKKISANCMIRIQGSGDKAKVIFIKNEFKYMPHSPNVPPGGKKCDFNIFDENDYLRSLSPEYIIEI